MKDALSSTFIKFLTGSIVVVIFVSMLIGPANVYSFIMLSIICSFGTALFPWIGIAYIVGIVIDELIFLQLFRRQKPGLHIRFWVMQSNEERAVTEYIRNAKNYYMSEDTIRNILLDSGWNRKVIDRAFNMV